MWLTHLAENRSSACWELLFGGKEKGGQAQRDWIFRALQLYSTSINLALPLLGLGSQLGPGDPKERNDMV